MNQNVDKEKRLALESRIQIAIEEFEKDWGEDLNMLAAVLTNFLSHVSWLLRENTSK